MGKTAGTATVASYTPRNCFHCNYMRAIATLYSKISCIVYI